MAIYIPSLLDTPEMLLHDFEHLMNLYIGFYTICGLMLLIGTFKEKNSLVRKQRIILFMGFILPVGLIILDVVHLNGVTMYVNLDPIYETLRRYVFWTIPLTGILAILRYEVFGLHRSTHRQVLYAGTIGLIGAGCILLIGLTAPLNIGLNRLQWQDVWIILSGVALFWSGRSLYGYLHRWWADRNYVYSTEDFKVNLRILSSELLKVKSRRDLEAMISWNLPSDFGIRSAEWSNNDIASGPYALKLPLHITNVPLGTLFLGPKIRGGPFSAREKQIFLEVQKQISLAIFSLELDEAIRAKEALTRLKSKFLANVTHELRTPLNAMINYIGFVVDEADRLNQEQLYHLQQALWDAERLLELINNILDMSKIEAGQMTLSKEPVNLADVVAEALPGLTDLADTKSIEIITHVSKNLPSVRGDQVRLRQIIQNLLSNAIKFTEQGWVRLTIYPTNGQVIVEVSDTGKGIDEVTLPTIFQGFTTIALTDAGQVSGPGLGLPITKHLVNLHQGEIKVDSQMGVGTTFTVSLPA